LQHNSGFNFTSLINLAIRRFISLKQVIEPVEIIEAKDDDVKNLADKMILKHAHMLKKLK